MDKLSSSEAAVVAYINNSWERFACIDWVIAAHIQDAWTVLTQEQIWLTVWSLKRKGLLEYTWIKEDLLYILHSKLPK